MKNALIGLLLVFTGAQAHARSLIAAQAANLTSFNFAAGSDLAKRDISSGTIILDYIQSEVTLTLQPSFHCPPGRFCAQMMPAAIEVTLPLVSRQVDVCGVVHYIAKKDLRPADGINQMIEVSDNRANICPTFAVLPSTGLVYIQQGFDRLGAKEFKYVHTFSADVLQAR